MNAVGSMLSRRSVACDNAGCSVFRKIRIVVLSVVDSERVTPIVVADCIARRKCPRR
jgi:hypothetical protein